MKKVILLPLLILPSFCFAQTAIPEPARAFLGTLLAFSNSDIASILCTLLLVAGMGVAFVADSLSLGMTAFALCMLIRFMPGMLVNITGIEVMQQSVSSSSVVASAETPSQIEPARVVKPGAIVPTPHIKTSEIEADEKHVRLPVSDAKETGLSVLTVTLAVAGVGIALALLGVGVVALRRRPPRKELGFTPSASVKAVSAAFDDPNGFIRSKVNASS